MASPQLLPPRAAPHRRIAGALLFVLAACGFGASPVAALSYRMMSDDALLQQAQGVALFEVVHVAAARAGDTETRYLLRQRRGLGGAPTFAFEWLALPGAVSATERFIVDGIPVLRPGEQWLLFHHRRADGVLQPVQLSLGMFRRFDDGSADGSYLRTVDLEVQKSGDRNAGFAARRDAEGFERWLRGAAAGKSLAVDYLRPADASKYTFLRFAMDTPMPARWFEFDAGDSVPVLAGAAGQDGTTHDEFAALRQAIDAWNDDPGSAVALDWAGPGAADTDAAVEVFWNDPSGRIGGSFDCARGGVLAIGGASASVIDTAAFGDETWARRLRGFVVVQDGAGCWMDGGNGANGAELLTHELGHVLALGHSCGDTISGSCTDGAHKQAAMRATMHERGRGAQLGADDRAGIAVPYPAPAAMLIVVHTSGFEVGSD